MPYQIQKNENYSNLGGINTKLSQYLTRITEFLNLENIDFRTPGSLSSFAGSTQISIDSVTGPISGIVQKTYGNLTALGSTLNGLISTTSFGGAYELTGYTFSNTYVPIYSGNSTFTPSSISAGFETYPMYDFSSGNYLFGANAFEFWTAFNVGPSYLQYSLPFPYTALDSSSFAGSTGGLSGLIEIDFAFIRSDGLVGPFEQRFFGATGSTGLTITTPSILPGWGVSYSNFGISGLLAWYSLNGSSPKGTSAIYAPNSSFTLNDQFASYIINVPPIDILGNFPLGSAGATFGAGLVIQAPPSIYSFNPRCIETYNNQLFMGGFQTNPDVFWVSLPGEFEKRDPENFFSVGADDGDIISNMKAYFTQIIIFKVNSTYAVAGDDPDNFAIAQTTNQYGCLSNNSACVWEQKLWFLDKKGICQYDGANTQIVSTRIEPIFRRMNIAVARITSSMVHVKERNEIWCAIPIDGAQYNNIIAVYDYVSDAWTTRTISNLSFLSETSKSYTAPLPYFGNYSGMIHQFGQSLLTDNGVPFTCRIKTRYANDMGNSVEKQFRRLYLDMTIPSGVTQNIGINFYADQGSSPYMSMTMSMTQFQQRIDYGIPAKDLSYEFIYNGGQFLQLNGYSIDFRYQRNT